MIGLKALAALLLSAATGATLVLSDGPAPRHAAPADSAYRSPAGVAAATADAQSARMRKATALLATELRAASRCPGRREAYQRCVTPALRHAVIGGRTAALVMRTVVAPVPDGACRAYLLELQAANQGASEMAKWTLWTLRDRTVGDRARRADRQVALAAGMLSRASARGGQTACTVAASGPAA